MPKPQWAITMSEHIRAPCLLLIFGSNVSWLHGYSGDIFCGESQNWKGISKMIESHDCQAISLPHSIQNYIRLSVDLFNWILGHVCADVSFHIKENIFRVGADFRKFHPHFGVWGVTVAAPKIAFLCTFFNTLVSRLDSSYFCFRATN